MKSKLRKGKIAVEKRRDVYRSGENGKGSSWKNDEVRREIAKEKTEKDRTK